MKTMENFLEFNESKRELFEKTIEQGGVDWSDLIERPNDYYDASNGSVPGMIYYSDTEQFAKDNIREILTVYAEWCAEVGVLEIDKYNPLNWLAWFAWESMMSELMNWLDF